MHIISTSAALPNVTTPVAPAYHSATNTSTPLCGETPPTGSVYPHPPPFHGSSPPLIRPTRSNDVPMWAATWGPFPSLPHGPHSTPHRSNYTTSVSAYSSAPASRMPTTPPSAAVATLTHVPTTTPVSYRPATTSHAPSAGFHGGQSSAAEGSRVTAAGKARKVVQAVVVGWVVIAAAGGLVGVWA